MVNFTAFLNNIQQVCLCSETKVKLDRMEMEEIQLILKLRMSDESAFNKIYNTYWQNLYCHCYRKIKSREAAEEIVHDVFADLWTRRHSLEITISLAAYLFQAASYSAFKYLKKLKDKEQFVNEMAEVMRDELHAAGHPIEFTELNQLLISSMSLLPNRCRTIFEMSRFKQLSHREISEELEISVKTVENQITKALLILRTSLKDYVLPAQLS